MIGSDVMLAARLIQWGLRRGSHAGREPEYAELIRFYRDRPEFRRAVHDVATGLFLEVVDVSDRGMVLAAPPDSAFAPRTANMRGQTGADDRLIFGIIHVAIATTVFPRPGDLDEYDVVGRPAITVDEVEGTLRQICARLEERFRDRPPPTVDDEAAGLHDAWLAFHHRAPEMLTESGQRSSRGTRRMIEATLDRLSADGMFRRSNRDGTTRYQPLYAYLIQVREYGASRIAEIVEQVLTPPEEAADSGAGIEPTLEED
jgi:hypothetical protein